MSEVDRICDEIEARMDELVAKHRRQPQIEHAVFVFKHRTTGEIYAKYLHDPIVNEDEYEHVATLDPALWIMTHYHKIVDGTVTP